MANKSGNSEESKTINISKFPRTRHLMDSGGNCVTRDDLLMTKNEAKMFIKGNVLTVEEKIDGANIGISMSEDYQIMVQNRSHFITSNSHKQFAPLDKWISQHSEELLRILQNGKYIIFGEWMFAKHSILYTNLPDYFLAFDLYDVESGRYLSTTTRNGILEGSGIQTVPLIVEREFQSVDELLPLLQTRSQYYNGPVEGIYLRIDEDKQTNNDGNNRSKNESFLANRAKIVRADFSQNIEAQWTRQKFTKNICSFYY